MKFRIIKESDGFYIAEYKEIFLWWYVDGSASRNIEKTRDACRQFYKNFFEKEEDGVIVESFKL